MDPDLLPDALYTAEQVRELDRIAIEEQGIPGLTLMRRAARACLATIENNFPALKSVTVFCGSGNNAGDGYILAGMLAERGCNVQVMIVGDPDKLGEDATAGWEYCRSTTAVVAPFDAGDAPIEDELVVDALLGTGLRGEVRAHYR
ncbi:MAG: NAD(P)H-hydrate epimerase, partial [Pseudomonadales bacterium]|nr:NAD(P)H-hydrate epimerase [Pseudomonadales bacterium]